MFEIKTSYISLKVFGLMSRVFVNGPGNWGLIPG